MTTLYPKNMYASKNDNTYRGTEIHKSSERVYMQEIEDAPRNKYQLAPFNQDLSPRNKLMNYNQMRTL